MKTVLEQKIQNELGNYFECAGKRKCPPSMKHNLYAQIAKEKKSPWFNPRLAMAGLSMVFVSALVFNISSKHQQQEQLMQAQVELQVAMHYINQISMKSLSAVNTNGIKPGLIKPLAKTYASL
jgi:hypothetical protein